MYTTNLNVKDITAYSKNPIFRLDIFLDVLSTFPAIIY